MNIDELKLIERLRKADKEAEQSFRDRYEADVANEIYKLAEAGIVSFDDKHRLIDEVLREFLRLIKSGWTITDTKLSLAELIRVFTGSKLYKEYLDKFGFMGEWSLLKLPPSPFEFDEKGSAPLTVRTPRVWLLERPTQRIAFRTEDQLTPQYLSSQIIPYINALMVMQHVFDDLRQRERSKVVIKSITQRSPISLGLEGVGDAIDSVKEDVVPWRKQNAQKVAALKLKETEAEIKKKQAEAVEIRARSAKERAEAKKIEAEAVKMREDAVRQKIENEKLRFELDSSKLKLALELVQKMHPDLSEPDRLAHAIRLLPALNTLTTSDMEPKVPRADKG